MKKILCLAIALTAALSVTASAQTVYTWNVTSGNWNVAGNWTPGGGPPVAGDTAIINTSSAAVVLNATPINGVAINQSAGSASRTSSLALQNLSYNLTGGNLSVTGASNLTLTNSTLTVNGGNASVGSSITLASGGDFNLQSGAASATSLQLGTEVGNTASISGGTFTGNITGAQNTVFNVSGGIVNASTSTFSGNPGAIVNLSGGTFNAGALSLARVSTGTAARINISGSADLTASSLTYTTTLTLIPQWDFSSAWTGSFSLTGSTTLTDYWNSLTSNGSFNNVRLDNTLINQTTFNDTFLINSGALAIVPEPSTWLLLCVGLTTVIIFRSRRTAQS